VLLHRLRLRALEREDGAREVGKRLQVTRQLHLATGDERREAQYLGVVVRRRAGDQRVEAQAHVLEDAAAPVDAGYAGLDEEPVRDELA